MKRSEIATKLLLILCMMLGFSTQSLASIDLSKYNREFDELQLRTSETYKRVFPICYKKFDFSITQYAAEAAKEVGNLALFDLETWNTKMGQKLLISKRLEKDLAHPGFRQAMHDCGMSETHEKIFVANLIATDIFGKIGGGLAAYVLMRSVVIPTGKALYTKFPRAIGGLTLGAVVYELRNMLLAYFNAKEAAAAQAQQEPMSEEEIKGLVTSIFGEKIYGSDEASQAQSAAVAFIIERNEEIMATLDSDSLEYKMLAQENADFLELLEL